jgi:hypothetical protein
MYAEKNGDTWTITKIDKGWDWDDKTLQDSLGNTGWFASLALDSDDIPVIVYYDRDQHKLMNAQRGAPDREFAHWPTGMPDSLSAGKTWMYLTLAIDNRDRRHISFYDAEEKSLIYYQFTGRGPIKFQRVDSDHAGQYAALALDASGNPHIAYYSETAHGIRYASMEG